MLPGIGRLVTSALQVSPVGRVDASHALLRVGCHSDKEAYHLICRGAVKHCLGRYCGAGAPASVIGRFAALHVKGDEVGVPRWAETSREATVLDVVRWPESEEPGCDSGGGTSGPRCNSVVLLHDTEGPDAVENLQRLSAEVLPHLVSHGIPVVLAGAVDAATLAQSGRFAAMSLYGRWQQRYAKLAARNFGHVYSVHFFCPQEPRGCFDLLYRAQMSALYPLQRCFVASAEGIRPTPALLAATRAIFEESDADRDGVWSEGDWRVFWGVVHDRPPTADELEHLAQSGLTGATEMRVVQWFLELVAEGRGDAFWASLRAFGYDGALRRQSGQRSPSL